MEDSAGSESTRLYGRLTARLQREIPEHVSALGLFCSRELGSLPLHLALAVTADRVYVFSMPSLQASSLLEVWDRAGLQATAEERHVSWAVRVALPDGRRLELHAKRLGANHVNGEAVKALTGL